MAVEKGQPLILMLMNPILGLGRPSTMFIPCHYYIVKVVK